MNREQMIEAIYEKIADKSLTKGCILHYDYIDGDIKFKAELEIVGFNEDYIDGDYVCGDYISGVFIRIDNVMSNLDTDFVEEIELVNFDENKEEEIILEALKEDGYDEVEIIGHPVMIGDVLDFINKNKIANNCNECLSDISEAQLCGGYKCLECGNFYGHYEIINYIYDYWGEKRKPIEEQSIECVEYIYNLLKNEN